jgi:hypothetical protein
MAHRLFPYPGFLAGPDQADRFFQIGVPELAADVAGRPQGALAYGALRFVHPRFLPGTFETDLHFNTLLL